MQEFARTWFALLADGTLAILGDHGDYEAADATATDLGYDAIWLVCGEDAAQWADTINSQRTEDWAMSAKNFDHVADDRMRAILSSDAPTREDIEYGLDHCVSSLMLDNSNPDVDYRTLYARARAVVEAEDATSLADALQSLRRFWEV